MIIYYILLTETEKNGKLQKISSIKVKAKTQ